MRYFCCDERRREAVRATGVLNGIDFLEVVDSEATAAADRQRLLRMRFLHVPPPPLKALIAGDVQIVGGTRVTGINVQRADEWDGQILTVRVDRPGDYSVYTLRVGDPPDHPLPGLDPLLSSVDFSFKVECPTGFDCVDERVCPPELLDEPEIDYLARDFASFRQLMLDRMSVLVPDWRERNPADLGIALVEILAYTADHLSYELDAIGMEATLATARRRPSARRHARLVDYAMYDGANARTWVQVQVDAAGVALPAGTRLFSQVPGVPTRVSPFSDTERRVEQFGPAVFETMHDALLHDELNELPLYTWGDRECCLPAGTRLFSQVPGVPTRVSPFSDTERRVEQFGPAVFETMHDALLHDELNTLPLYTWGDRECCLPAGATSATLRGSFPTLAPGAVLVFVEQKGPRTGAAADADPEHRHPVRLIHVDPRTDPIGTWFDDEAAPAAAVDVTEVGWAVEDALPFPLCVSATDRSGDYHDDVSVALGNIVLADHGRTLAQELPAVPQSDPRLALVSVGAGAPCEPSDPVPMPPRYTPALAEVPLTMAGTTGRARRGAGPRRWERFDATAAAASALVWEQGHVIPDVALAEVGSGRPWYPRRDLLASDAFSREFVVELDPDGRARIRFGDDEYGMRPAAGTTFVATYRVGNGPAGNIGADALRHVLTTDPRLVAVTNPLPARGGIAPESIEHVRRSAPSAFRTQQRAVTPEDYAEVAGRHTQVQRAVATERWTGSWYTIFLTVDRRGGLPVDALFETELRARLERFRMAGHDFEIDGPRFIWLEVELCVCVLSDYYRADVRRELLEVLGSRTRPDGSRGFFHPDGFTFGQPVYLSRLYAAAQAVPGVRYVEALTFRRLGDEDTSALASGELTIGRLEIARLDDDPNFPERGVLRLMMEGGR